MLVKQSTNQSKKQCVRVSKLGNLTNVLRVSLENWTLIVPLRLFLLSGGVGGAENARLENAELENAAPNCKTGKRETGKRENGLVMESRSSLNSR